MFDLPKGCRVFHHSYHHGHESLFVTVAQKYAYVIYECLTIWHIPLIMNWLMVISLFMNSTALCQCKMLRPLVAKVCVQFYQLVS